MNKIIKKIQYSEKVYRFDVEAPLIAKSRKAGNFVIIRVDDNSERMPLTIADADIEKGTITLVVQKVGLSSTKLCSLNEGDEIHDVVGPLGNPTHIENYGTVICAGGGVGVAPMLPIMRALKAAGNRVLSVIAGRNKELVIMEDEVRASSDELIIMTDDGSYGEKGVVTVGIEKLINQEHIDKVFAIGPPIMMKFCCLLTQKYNLPTDVSLNTIMVDGTGMCGACRLTIGGKTKFVCIDGPEFDGALVDWDEMFKRMGTFKDAEREEMEHFEEHLATVETNKNKETTDVMMDVEPTTESIAELTDRNSEWRKQLRTSMKAKERTAIERVKMPEIEKVFRNHTNTPKIRFAKFVTQTVKAKDAKINNHDGTMNTILGLLAKGDMNCSGDEISNDLFTNNMERPLAADSTPKASRNPNETAGTGVVPTPAQKREEELRKKKEEEERLAKIAEEEEKEREEKKRKENSFLHKGFRKLKDFFLDTISEEE